MYIFKANLLVWVISSFKLVVFVGIELDYNVNYTVMCHDLKNHVPTTCAKLHKHIMLRNCVK